MTEKKLLPILGGETGTNNSGQGGSSNSAGENQNKGWQGRETNNRHWKWGPINGGVGGFAQFGSEKIGYRVGETTDSVRTFEGLTVGGAILRPQTKGYGASQWTGTSGSGLTIIIENEE